MLLRSVIVDIDGTVFDISHRLSLLEGVSREGSEKTWKVFYSLMNRDSPKWSIIHLVRLLETKYKIVFCTGRSNEYREDTIKQLKTVFDFPFKLFMRNFKDHRPDYAVKDELRKKIEQEHEIVLVLEDREKVVKMWRDAGHTCLQVASGDTYVD